MNLFKHRYRVSLALPLAGALLCLGAAQAATVKCTVRGPHGMYVAYLFKTGDARPTAVSQPFAIAGGKVVSFSGISGPCRYFIRVEEQSGTLRGQTNDRFLLSYFIPFLDLGDCNMS